MIRIAILLALAAVPAHAVCGPSLDAVLTALKHQYGEATVMVGKMPDGRPMVITANPKTGTWTALVMDPSGTTCAPASGTDFHITPPGDPA